MEMLSGAEMVVRSLIDQGVKHLFGYPGGTVLDIYDALHTVGESLYAAPTSPSPSRPL